MRWPTPAHVYDVCSRTYLGHHSQWHGNVGRTDIVTLALLPYRVRKLTVAGTTIRARTSTPYTVLWAAT